jgi:dTMP kinase
MYLTLEGPDGAGKSTAVADLVCRLRASGRSVVAVDKHYQVRSFDAPASLDDDHRARFAELQPVTYGPFPDGRHLWGDHHWLFILGSWYSLLDEVVVGPALAEGSVVLLDNAHYKTLARYVLKPDFPVDLAWHVFANLRRPDLVVYLDVDPVTAMRRKGGFEAIEAGFGGSEADHFVAHQRDLGDVMRSFGARWGWKHVDTTHASLDEVADQVWAVVEPALE